MAIQEEWQAWIWKQTVCTLYPKGNFYKLYFNLNTVSFDAYFRNVVLYVNSTRSYLLCVDLFSRQGVPTRTCSEQTSGCKSRPHGQTWEPVQKLPSIDKTTKVFRSSSHRLSRFLCFNKDRRRKNENGEITSQTSPPSPDPPSSDTTSASGISSCISKFYSRYWWPMER